MTADDCSSSSASGDKPKYKYVQKEGLSPIERWVTPGYNFFTKPAIWFRETFVEPNQKQYPWYHQKIPRVKNVDECYTDDHVCIYEAREQFKRDKEVDSNILQILRSRIDDCIRKEYPDHIPKCMQLKEEYEVAATNWFIKYGDLGYNGVVENAYMKQKHRLIWERRHGPVGTGMKTDPYDVKDDHH